MKLEELAIGDEVRYHKTGDVYSVTDIYEIEVSAGCHSYDMTVVDLTDGKLNLRQVSPLDLSPADISSKILPTFIDNSQLGDVLRKWMSEYNKKTGDVITGIQWDTLTSDKIWISSKKMGTRGFKINLEYERH